MNTTTSLRTARRVVVVGASGFVGRNVAEEAKKSDLDVISVDRVVAVDQVGMRRCDLLVDDLEWLDDEQIVLWCAGSSDHRGSWVDPRGDLEANVVGLIRMLQRFSGRLVFVSSGAVYHGLTGLVGPDIHLAPGFPYGISKLTAERYVHAFADAGLLDEFVVLRLFHPYGPGEPSRRIMARLVHRFGIERARDIRLFGDGDTLMDVLPIAEVAEAIVRAAVASTNGTTFDICAGNPPTLRSLARSVAEAFGIDANIEGDPSAAEEAIEFFADPEPGRVALGLRPPRPLGAVVQEYAAWLRTNADA